MIRELNAVVILKAMPLWASLLLPIAHSQAQTGTMQCDGKLIPAQESTPYVLRGDRCEGIYSVSKASAPTLSLVGFVKGRFSYSMDPAEEIRIRVPPEVPRTLDPILIRAQPYSLLAFYRMDSILSHGQLLRWPVKDVLLPNEMQANDIGVYGYYPDKEITVYVPLLIESSELKNPKDRDLRLYLRSTQDIEYLWSFWKCENQNPVTIEPKDKDKDKKVFWSSKPIRIFPPPNLRGLCFVKFRAVIKKRDTGGEGNEVQLDLYLHLSK